MTTDEATSGYRIPASLSTEIDKLAELIRRHETAEVSAVELKAHRVPFGVYEQRAKGTYMMRIRCPGGTISAAQLRAVGAIAHAHGSNRIHITTRQEVQIHDLALRDLPAIMRALRSAGLSTRGGGGNTVRNITASWDSGISPDDAFDVTPYVLELTSRLTADPTSWLLPRKFKIAFSSSDRDTAFATFTDLGFVATREGGRRGFRVYVAGGMGRMPRAASILHDFAPAHEAYEIAESVKRLFSKLGNRRNRHAARLRFVWNSLGRDEFIRQYMAQREVVAGERHAPVTIDDVSTAHSTAEESAIAQSEPGAEQSLWQSRHTGEQPVTGLRWVRLPMVLGDFDASAANALADWVESHAGTELRFTTDQNVVLRNVPLHSLASAYDLARRVSPQHALPPVLATAVACAGAGTCQLGICLSRNALDAVLTGLRDSNLPLDRLGNFRLYVSGCPNSCGQHPLADLGFHGKALRHDRATYPAYAVFAGARIDRRTTSALATHFGDIAARNLPAFTLRVLGDYLARSTPGLTWSEYLVSGGADQIRAACRDLAAPPQLAIAPDFYRDWGANTQFSLDGRGSGECAAGLFDLIDLELSQMREAVARSRITAGIERGEALYAAASHAASALLITQGHEAKSPRDAFELFKTHLLSEVSDGERFVALLEHCRDTGAVESRHELDVYAFASEVEKLYARLDDSLQFHRETASESRAPRATRDLRGVTCPLNFVKTKMELSRLADGDILEILLDDGAPIDNVPRSVASEGHQVVHNERAGTHWVVRIQKGGASA